MRALVDTGCSRTVLRPGIREVRRGSQCYVIAVDGGQVHCKGRATIPVSVGGELLWINCVVALSIFSGVDLILGMDVISKLGGVTVTDKSVSFGALKNIFYFNTPVTSGSLVASVVANTCTNVVEIKDQDFTANFDGKLWTVRWHWKQEQPPKLKNKVACYKSVRLPETEEKFNDEVESWISKGWLKPYNGPNAGDGIIPLMAVIQANKNKVRPVMEIGRAHV